jgi:hypothetical protein
MGEVKQKTTKPADYIGSAKSCPMYGSPHHFSFCRNDCEWNDGEGCAVWRIVKALERGNYWLELLVKERDSK